MRKGGHAMQDKFAGDQQVVGGRIPQEPVWDKLREVHERQEEVLYPAGNEGDVGCHGAEIIEDFVGDFETGGSAYKGIAGTGLTGVGAGHQIVTRDIPVPVWVGDGL